MSEGAKQRLSIVIDLAKTAFHYGFIPTVLYLGKVNCLFLGLLVYFHYKVEAKHCINF